MRLIHASPDAPAVDVAVAGTSTLVFSNVAFKGVGAYTPVDAGTYDLEVRAAGTSTVALTISDLALADRNVYTAVAVGLIDDGSLQVVPLLDATAPATTPTASPTGPAPAPPHTGSGLASDESARIGALPMLGLAIAMIVIAGLAFPPRSGLAGRSGQFTPGAGRGRAVRGLALLVAQPPTAVDRDRARALRRPPAGPRR